MKSGKIKWIWSLSIASALLVILLQGYWLYNQYRFETEKAADTAITQTLSTWDEYKTERKKRLKLFRDNLKSYNSNVNQNSAIYLSDIKENETEWTISVRALKNLTPFPIQERDTVFLDKEQKTSHDILSEASQRLMMMQSEKIANNDTASVAGFVENVQETDSTLVGTFRFKTTMSQNAIYDAVDLYLADINLPFQPNELDSLLKQHTQSISARIDTLSLPQDSVLWEPISVKNRSFLHPSVTVQVPYNVLKRKVAEVTVPLVPTDIMRRMAFQIIACLVLIFVLIVCLLLQIQTISRQQRIGKLRQNFVSTTLHELKRPVQTLKTIVSYLQTRESEAADMLNDAREETDNLTSYLQKLREVNQAETITESLHLSYFDFTAVAKENIEKVRKNTAKRLHIETHFPSTSLSITADKMAIGNVIINLLENAVKYSGDDAHIIFRAEKRNNRLIFSVSDNGIGIAPTEQNAIFEPFYRSKNAYVASLPGMGLGLSYVKMAVEVHRGSVSVASKPQQGTTFTIEIPLL